MLTRIFFFTLIICSIAYHSEAVEVTKKAQILFKEALEFNATGDYPTAVSRYIEAYNEDSNIAGLTDEGILLNATNHFQNLLKGDPQNSDILMWLGTIQSLKGDYTAAIKFYQKVVDIDPNSAQGLEADKEILRIESQIKKKQKEKIESVKKESQKMQEIEILRENLRREMEEEYAAKLESMRNEISELNSRIQKAQKETEELKQKHNKLTEEHAALKELNGHHRRMYLLYKYKKK